MEISRRTAIKGAALVGLTAFPTREAQAAGLAAAAGTTLVSTVVRGAAGKGGYTLLASGPGEPHAVREDLGTKAVAGRAARRTTLAAFAQLTDMHLIDAQSPARVEYLDR